MSSQKLPLINKVEYLRLLLNSRAYSKIYGEAQRNSKNIHVSDLGSFCPRKYFFAGNLIERSYKHPGNNTNKTHMIFLYGNALHNLTKNLIKDHLAGVFVCKSCHHKHPFSAKKDLIKCEKCGNTSFSYEEYELKIPIGKDRYLVGHTDLIIDLKDIMQIGEIKSMSVEQYASLIQPLPEHIAQISTYMWMVSKNKQNIGIDYSCGYIIYIPKGNVYNKQMLQPWKVFPVPFNLSLGSSLDNLVKILKQSIKGILPKEGLCSNSYDPKAIKCPYVKKCFGGEDNEQ